MGPFMKDDLLISPVKNEIPNSKFFKKNSQKESKIDQSTELSKIIKKPPHTEFLKRFVLSCSQTHYIITCSNECFKYFSSFRSKKSDSLNLMKVTVITIVLSMDRCFQVGQDRWTREEKCVKVYKNGFKLEEMQKLYEKSLFTKF